FDDVTSCLITITPPTKFYPFPTRRSSDLSSSTSEDSMYGLARPFLFALDAERAHGLGLSSLEALHRMRVQRLLGGVPRAFPTRADRKSTRLNSSHVKISYAVFCLKKKKIL